MFKTKKELIKENLLEDKEMLNSNDFVNDGICIGVDVAFKSFAERINFYNLYEEDSGKLQKVKPNDYKKFLEHRNGKWHEIGIENWNKDYRKWLFDYCFGDVKE
jgi:hypothetical protein